MSTLLSPCLYRLTYKSPYNLLLEDYIYYFHMHYC